jgi:hypothetical protein
MNRYINLLVGILFAGILLFLTFNRHKSSDNFTYHSEIWGDKAGYYVYLPAAVKFGFKPRNFPEAVDVKTGGGFKLDYKEQKVRTKYTYGVALMQLPFFLIADVLAKPLGYESNGFSPIYHSAINISAIFYLFFGLFFLKKFLKKRVESRVAWVVVIGILLASNLYYYSIEETGMSHVYSFSLFSFTLFILQKTNFLKNEKGWQSLVVGLLFGLIVVIRPSNIIFLSCYLLLDIINFSEFKTRLKRILKPKVFGLVLLGSILMLLPQLLYWNYLNGSWVSYSYGNEGFNWLNPKLLNTWFSPNNGLFLYTPFYFLILLTLGIMIKNKVQNGVFILFLFLFISYVFASWWDWSFGCSFGARSFVEYLSIFSIVIAYGVKYTFQLGAKKRALVYLITFAIIAFNLKMIYSYDGCFYGERNWDWSFYVQLVFSPTK